MTKRDDHTQFAEWSREWQSTEPSAPASAADIRNYVRTRGRVVRSFLIADLIIGGVMLPVLLYLASATDEPLERAAMLALATITVGAVAFGWWNWRGVVQLSAASVAEFVAISLERLRRMRLAWRFAWLVLAGEVIVFTIWIRDQHAGGAVSEGAAIFAWSWLLGFSLAAAIGLVLFGRWLRRDAARFDGLRRSLLDQQMLP